MHKIFTGTFLAFSLAVIGAALLVLVSGCAVLDDETQASTTAAWNNAVTVLQESIADGTVTEQEATQIATTFEAAGLELEESFTSRTLEDWAALLGAVLGTGVLSALGIGVRRKSLGLDARPTLKSDIQKLLASSSHPSPH